MTFEPEVGAAEYPAFAALFAGEPALYLELLHLPSTTTRAWDALARALAEAVPAQLVALLAARNWRPNLVGAAALVAQYAAGAAPNADALAALWDALARGPWCAPQLAACALVVDADAVIRAQPLFASAAPKSAAALIALVAPRLPPLARVRALSLLDDPRLQTPDAQDGARFAVDWHTRLLATLSGSRSL